jgi:hypothetical protein
VSEQSDIRRPWRHPLRRTSLLRQALWLIPCMAALAGAAAAQRDEDGVTIEGLLKSGWQIAGYTSSVDNRSAFILFRHPGETYLVQCRTGYDVTREDRVYANCYKLR